MTRYSHSGLGVRAVKLCSVVLGYDQVWSSHRRRDVSREHYEFIHLLHTIFAQPSNFQWWATGIEVDSCTPVQLPQVLKRIEEGPNSMAELLWDNILY